MEWFMDKKKQSPADDQLSSDYRFNNLYCHPDFLSEKDDNIAAQVFGNVSKIDRGKKEGQSSPASMHAIPRRKH
jgi:hypothetical protein